MQVYYLIVSCIMLYHLLPCAMVPSTACHRQIGRILVRQSRLARMHSAPMRVRHCGAARGGVVLAAGLAEEIQKKNASNSVVVYSKTYCALLSGGLVVSHRHAGPYCTQVKSLFGKLGVDAKVVELDQLGMLFGCTLLLTKPYRTADGADIQATLADITGRSTVPQVFIGGQFVGGCDGAMGQRVLACNTLPRTDTMAAHNSGKLKELFVSAGVAVGN